MAVRPCHGASGWATERPQCSNFIHGEIFSPRGVVIRALLGVNHSTGANLSTGLPAARCTAPGIFFSYCTIGIPFRAPDRAK
jgi:hypothetical protein